MNFDIVTTMSVAVLSSFSHCYAMCGGFNLAFLRLNLGVSAEKNGNASGFANGASFKTGALNANTSPHSQASTLGENGASVENKTNSASKNSANFTLVLTYHAFRICAYVLLGVIFGAFGNVLAFLNKGVLFFALGVFMVVLGVALIFRGQILALIENPFFFNAFAKKIWQRVNFKGYKSAVVLGFCNGFVPCGLVYFALALAMSQQNLWQSALIMLIFGLCTLPALLFFSELARILGQKIQIWTQISAFIIMLYGLYLAYVGVSLTR